MEELQCIDSITKAPIVIKATNTITGFVITDVLFSELRILLYISIATAKTK